VAARLARDLGSNAVLVHVDDRGGTRKLPRPPSPRRDRRRRKLLKATAAECCFPAGTRAKLATGDPTRELLATARVEDAELLVVSTGGLSTASPALLGGTASALIREAPCPVAVVPARSAPPLDAEGLRDVVCAIEGRPGDAAVLGLGSDLATRLGGELHTVANRDDAIDPGEFAIEAERHFVRGPLDGAVKRVASEVRAGLAVVRGPAAPASMDEPQIPLAIALAADGDVPVVVLTGVAQLHAGSGHYELTGSAA
jgi:nucleotide-binding universal stress UspA family protein